MGAQGWRGKEEELASRVDLGPKVVGKGGVCFVGEDHSRVR